MYFRIYPNIRGFPFPRKEYPPHSRGIFYATLLEFVSFGCRSNINTAQCFVSLMENNRNKNDIVFDQYLFNFLFGFCQVFVFAICLFFHEPNLTPIQEKARKITDQPEYLYSSSVEQQILIQFPYCNMWHNLFLQLLENSIQNTWSPVGFLLLQ